MFMESMSKKSKLESKSKTRGTTKRIRFEVARRSTKSEVSAVPHAGHSLYEPRLLPPRAQR